MLPSRATGLVTSTPAVLTVDTRFEITQEPADVTVVRGSTATFSVSVNSSETPAYQWYLNDVPISGAVNASFTTEVTSMPMNGWLYKCRITVGAESVFTRSALLTVRPN